MDNNPEILPQLPPVDGSVQKTTKNKFLYWFLWLAAIIAIVLFAKAFLNSKKNPKIELQTKEVQNQSKFAGITPGQPIPDELLPEDLVIKGEETAIKKNTIFQIPNVTSSTQISGVGQLPDEARSLILSGAASSTMERIIYANNKNGYKIAYELPFNTMIDLQKALFKQAMQGNSNNWQVKNAQIGSHLALWELENSTAIAQVNVVVSTQGKEFRHFEIGILIQ